MTAMTTMTTMSVRRTRPSVRLVPAVLAAVAAAATLSGCIAVSKHETGTRTETRGPAAAVEPAAVSRPLVVNLAAGPAEVHRCDQALTLALAARGQGRDVVLFLNVDAPRLADARTPLMAGLPGKPSLRAQLEALIEQGVEVVVARGCAGVCDVDLEELVDGARPGTAGEIAGMIAGGAGVISY